MDRPARRRPPRRQAASRARPTGSLTHCSLSTRSATSPSNPKPRPVLPAGLLPLRAGLAHRHQQPDLRPLGRGLRRRRRRRRHDRPARAPRRSRRPQRRQLPPERPRPRPRPHRRDRRPITPKVIDFACRQLINFRVPLTLRRPTTTRTRAPPADQFAQRAKLAAGAGPPRHRHTLISTPISAPPIVAPTRSGARCKPDPFSYAAATARHPTRSLTRTTHADRPDEPLRGKGARVPAQHGIRRSMLPGGDTAAC